MYNGIREIQRKAIIAVVNAGRSDKKIAESNNIRLETVEIFKFIYRSHLKKGSEDSILGIRRKGFRKKSDSLIEEDVHQIQGRIDENQSVTSIVRQLGFSDSTGGEILKGLQIHFIFSERGPDPLCCAQGPGNEEGQRMVSKMKELYHSLTHSFPL